MQLKGVWKFRPTRALLLGTTDPGSVLYRLPNSDGVLNIILGFVVLFYEEVVLAQRAHHVLEVACVQASKVGLFKRADLRSLTQWQMTLVACFAPEGVNETKGYVSTVPCSVALFWSSAQLMACQVFCMVPCVCVECLSDE